MKSIERILLINGEFPPISGGGGIYTANLAYGLAKQNPNLQITVLAGNKDTSSIPCQEKLLSNLKVIRVPELYLIDQGMVHIWQVTEALNDIVATFRPDVVHTHHTYESLAAFLCKQTFNFKLIITVQKSPVRFFDEQINDPQWSLIRFLYKQTTYDGVVVNSQAYFQMAKLLGAREPIRLIYYGIDRERFKENSKLAQKVREDLNIQEGQILIVVPSRIDERKGIDIIADALSLIKYNYRHFYKRIKVVVAGASTCSKSLQYQEFLIKKIRKLKIQESIKLGYKNGNYNSMNGLYNAADLIVVPSIREGLGFAAIEGMALKKPIIASDTVGLNEIVINNKNGLTFEVGNAKELARQILWAIENPAKLQRLAIKGFEWQKDKFLISSMTKEHLRFYQDILSGETSRG